MRALLSLLFLLPSVAAGEFLGEKQLRALFYDHTNEWSFGNEIVIVEFVNADGIAFTDYGDLYASAFDLDEPLGRYVTFFQGKQGQEWCFEEAETLNCWRFKELTDTSLEAYFFSVGGDRPQEEDGIPDAVLTVIAPGDLLQSEARYELQADGQSPELQDFGTI